VIYLDKKLVGDNELVTALAGLQKANPALRVFISGDQDARHGRMIACSIWCARRESTRSPSKRACRPRR